MNLLTDAEISTLSNKTGNWMHFARAIEAAVMERLTKVDVEHRYTLELPQGDTRAVKVFWTDRKTEGDTTTHALCIAVDEHDAVMPKVDVEPIPSGLHLMPDLQTKGKYVNSEVDVEPDTNKRKAERLVRMLTDGYSGMKAVREVIALLEQWPESPASALAELQAENERLRKHLDKCVKAIDCEVRGDGEGQSVPTQRDAVHRLDHQGRATPRCIQRIERKKLMAYYACKQVRDLLPQHIIDAQGSDYEGNAGYDGDQWDAAAEYIEELVLERDALRAELAELRGKRVALSDEQIIDAYQDTPTFTNHYDAFTAGVLYAEAAHGITGEAT